MKLITFQHDMMHFDLDKDKIKELVMDFVQSYKLTREMAAELFERIDRFVPSPIIPLPSEEEESKSQVPLQ